jgi:hypothetical protein
VAKIPPNMVVLPDKKKKNFFNFFFFQGLTDPQGNLGRKLPFHIIDDGTR